MPPLRLLEGAKEGTSSAIVISRTTTSAYSYFSIIVRLKLSFCRNLLTGPRSLRWRLRGDLARIGIGSTGFRSSRSMVHGGGTRTRAVAKADNPSQNRTPRDEEHRREYRLAEYDSSGIPRHPIAEWGLGHAGRMWQGNCP